MSFCLPTDAICIIHFLSSLLLSRHCFFFFSWHCIFFPSFSLCDCLMDFLVKDIQFAFFACSFDFFSFFFKYHHCVIRSLGFVWNPTGSCSWYTSESDGLTFKGTSLLKNVFCPICRRDQNENFKSRILFSSAVSIYIQFLIWVSSVTFSQTRNTQEV